MDSLFKGHHGGPIMGVLNRSFELGILNSEEQFWTAVFEMERSNLCHNFELGRRKLSLFYILYIFIIRVYIVI